MRFVTGITAVSGSGAITNESDETTVARDHLRVEIDQSGMTSYHMERETYEARQFDGEYGRYSGSDFELCASPLEFVDYS